MVPKPDSAAYHARLVSPRLFQWHGVGLTMPMANLYMGAAASVPKRPFDVQFFHGSGT